MAPTDYTSFTRCFKEPNFETENEGDMFYNFQNEEGFEIELQAEETVDEEFEVNADELSIIMEEVETPRSRWNANDIENGRTSVCRTLHFKSHVCRRLNFESENEED